MDLLGDGFAQKYVSCDYVTVACFVMVQTIDLTTAPAQLIKLECGTVHD